MGTHEGSAGGDAMGKGTTASYYMSIRPALEKITVAYSSLYDAPAKKGKPEGFVVHGMIYGTKTPMEITPFGDGYKLTKIESAHSSKVAQAIRKKEHLARPVYFLSFPKAAKEFPRNIILASQIKTLEVIVG